MSHTKEAKLAMDGKIKYQDALHQCYDIKEAIATAQPYSVAAISYGSAFLYNQGFLSYIYADEIRVLDVHACGEDECVLNIRNLLHRLIQKSGVEQPDAVEVSLQYYSDGILVLLIEVCQDISWLIALDMTRNCRSARLRMWKWLPSTNRLFVRHNRSYLYYGTHFLVEPYGCAQWTIQGVNLKTGEPITRKPVILEEFVGHDIGKTVCFELFHDHLYAVSNQAHFDEEDVDWTSYYVWACLPPDKSLGKPKLKIIWRRDHQEGPINDIWADISLQQDEVSGKLLIIECRRENSLSHENVCAPVERRRIHIA
jgi:hypothetical protein